MFRFRPRLTYANAVSTICLFILLGGGAWAASSFVGADGKIHGCADTRSGHLRVLKAHKHCTSNETAISWNQRGRTGQPGTVAPIEAVHLIAPAPTSGARNCSATLNPVAQFCGNPFGPDGFGYWANYGPDFQPAGFFKDRSGLVHLQGAVKTAGNASPDATIFFLPAAYRPSHQRLFSVYDEQNNPPVSYVKVWPNGRVTLRTGTPTTTPFLQLDGLDFRP